MSSQLSATINEIGINICYALVCVNLRIDEEEVHLEEGEERLQYGVRHQQVVHTLRLQRRVHRNLQTREDQSAEPKN